MGVPKADLPAGQATARLRGPAPRNPAPCNLSIGRDLIGQLIGNYRIISVLGEGGMGSVFSAVHVTAGFSAAIKVLHPDASGQGSTAARFLREAQVARRVRHPGTVQVYDLGQRADGLSYLVMELLQGETLAARLRARGPGITFLPILGQVAAALAAVHKEGIVHRDIKPENIMVTPDPAHGSERAVLLDFGIATSGTADGPERLTAPGDILGTPTYMSPEQGIPGADIDDRCDVYAFGALCYEILSGRAPFAGARGLELRLLHQHAEPAALASLVPGLPGEICALVHAMLAKDPLARPRMAEVCARLLGLCQPPVPGRPPRWRLTTIAGAAFLGLLCAGVMQQPRGHLGADLEGLWIYSLHDKRSDARVYGAFQLTAVSDELRVPIGQAWYVGDRPDPHSQRGSWRSRLVSVKEESVFILFQMESTTDRQEAGAARWYEGLLELGRSGTAGLGGTYHDLGPRHDHWGTLVAERARASSSEAATVEAYERFGRE